MDLPFRNFNLIDLTLIILRLYLSDRTITVTICIHCNIVYPFFHSKLCGGDVSYLFRHMREFSLQAIYTHTYIYMYMYICVHLLIKLL
jgi:hypothetical protein